MIEPIGPDAVVFYTVRAEEVQIGRANARLGEPWSATERAEGREVTFRQLGVTSPESAERLAVAFRRKSWAVTVDPDRELVVFRVVR